MHFFPNEFFHVYNRGNNKRPIFLNEDNYLLFTNKIKEQLVPYSSIIAYCLMPNHFHLMLEPKEEGLIIRNAYGGKPLQELAYRVGIMLSSYTQSVNYKNKKIGSLFQQKTKAKPLFENNNGSRISYFEQCFHYIHCNPLAAGLVKKAEDWTHSSYPFYIGLEDKSFCNKNLFYNITGMTAADIQLRMKERIDEKMVMNLF